MTHRPGADQAEETATGSHDPQADLRRLLECQLSVEKSIRYHLRRRSHFERLNELSMFGVVLAGSSAAAQISESSWVFGLVGASLGALDLAMGFGRKARLHDILHRRFCFLAKAIRREQSFDPARVLAWQDERTDIETDEPTVYWALEASCYNEVITMAGAGQDLCELRWHHRLLMHFWPFEYEKFPRRKAGSPDEKL